MEIKTTQEALVTIGNVMSALDALALPGNNVSGRQFCFTILGSLNDLEALAAFVGQLNITSEQKQDQPEDNKSEN